LHQPPLLSVRRRGLPCQRINRSKTNSRTHHLAFSGRHLKAFIEWLPMKGVWATLSVGNPDRTIACWLSLFRPYLLLTSSLKSTGERWWSCLIRMMGSSSPPHLEAEDTGDIGSKAKKRPRRISGCEHTILTTIWNTWRWVAYSGSHPKGSEKFSSLRSGDRTILRAHVHDEVSCIR